MSVFGVMYKMEYFRENLHTKQKTSRKNPSTSYAGPLVLSGPLCPAGISPPRGKSPLKGRLILGSLEKGAGSRRLTEGFFCEICNLRKFLPEFLHQLCWFPSY